MRLLPLRLQMWMQHLPDGSINWKDNRSWKTPRQMPPRLSRLKTWMQISSLISQLLASYQAWKLLRRCIKWLRSSSRCQSVTVVEHAFLATALLLPACRVDIMFHILPACMSGTPISEILNTAGVFLASMQGCWACSL